MISVFLQCYLLIFLNSPYFIYEILFESCDSILINKQYIQILEFFVVVEMKMTVNGSKVLVFYMKYEQISRGRKITFLLSSVTKY